ncbi:MAG: DUF4160 domain-containing protein [Oligoflexia bacterium]|nr:DUF4160 domain-containing protein [Oligoflexia bacterium]
MPVISFFYGIIIRMNFNDHAPPHFHAEYQGHQAAYEISKCSCVAGELPKSADHLIRRWCKIHRKELVDNWNKARKGEPLNRLPGIE